MAAMQKLCPHGLTLFGENAKALDLHVLARLLAARAIIENLGDVHEPPA